ncbi:MAG: glycosyltransferase family 4 protein [Acidobacteria bacterium]|nr:glycosyltransferase family 4 protein [Acidobacteriota bacterium]
MHVVFFNRSFYPDTAATGQILTDLCEDLVALHGCRVTVVTGVPLLPARDAGRAPARERYRGIDIRRVRGTAWSKRRFIGRATNYVTYFLSACWAGLWLDRPDVVVALTDPPIIGLAGWFAAARARAPFVMSYQDLFPEVTILLKDFQSPAVNAMLQTVNRFLCQRATRIVALGETMRARLIENKGAPPERTVIIPSGADTKAIVPGPKQNAFAARHDLTGSFVVMHSGNLGLSQSLETLVDAAACLCDVPDIRIVFQGDGVMKPELEARARALGLTNVLFLPFQPKETLGESFAAADLFVVSLQAGLAGYIVPSKLYGILAAGRPYVAAVDEACEVAAITRRHGCGVMARPGDARDLAAKILDLYRDRERLERAGASARAASLEFDRTAQVAKYMSLFTSLARPDGLSIPGKIAATSQTE